MQYGQQMQQQYGGPQHGQQPAYQHSLRSTMPEPRPSAQEQSRPQGYSHNIYASYNTPSSGALSASQPAAYSRATYDNNASLQANLPSSSQPVNAYARTASTATEQQQQQQKLQQAYAEYRRTGTAPMRTSDVPRPGMRESFETHSQAGSTTPAYAPPRQREEGEEVTMTVQGRGGLTRAAAPPPAPLSQAPQAPSELEKVRARSKLDELQGIADRQVCVCVCVCVCVFACV